MKVNICFLSLIIFLVSFSRCGTTERIKVTPDMASYQNDPDSEIRNIIFRYLGEGNTVYVNFKAMTYSGFSVLPGYSFQTREFGDFQNNQIVYHDVSLPFHLFMNYRINVNEGTSPIEKICKADINIRKPGSWKVDVYH
ncbi:MAG: hypothetical protein GXO83_09280 [Chlorobi bacterium]|nr:hypothetical protein [Chlorobiota bacterium]